MAPKLGSSAAITSIKIENVLHEFSSLAGVREDVTDIVLNVKQIALRIILLDPERWIDLCELFFYLAQLRCDLHRLFDEYKQDEWAKFLHTTTEWDHEMYMDCLP